ncbi:MAG: YqgE/AlgH family protein [Acidimicrobiia bacterium]|nr:YqgE/AlgH family protein [Acidimicrobiia bacterium]
MMGTMVHAIAPGSLLVATPVIGDPNFERTVVVVLEHAAEGSLGLVLNRPTDTEVGGPLPEWHRYTNTPPVVFDGGPVEQGRAIALAHMRPPTPAPPSSGGSDLLADVFAPLVGGVGTLDLSSDPDVVGVRIDGLRVYSGYAGWGPGQLDGELEMEAWWPVAAHPDDLLCDDPSTLWGRVLRRQRGTPRLFADFPHDPDLN